MTAKTAAGASIAIGPSVDIGATDSLAEFQALSYLEVGEVESIGEFGDESAVSTFTALRDSRVRKIKAARDAGTAAVVAAFDSQDAGQAAMSEAEGTKFDFAFRVTLADEPTEGSEPTSLYFAAQVMSERLNVGAQDNIVRRTWNLGINTEIFEDLATPT